MGILSIILFLPLLLMAAIPFFSGERQKSAIRLLALGGMLLQLVLVFAVLLPQFDASAAGYQFEEQVNWLQLDLGNLGYLKMEYHLGVDGISLGMVLLLAVLMPIAVLASWKLTHRIKAYFMLLMLLNTSLMGCFLALDFFLFYIFYEFMLLPMFLLIGMWGGVKREYAAIKFFLYTLLGSVFMLLVVLGLAFSYVDPVDTALANGWIQQASDVTPEFLEQFRSYMAAKGGEEITWVHTFDFVHLSAQVGSTPAYLLPGSLLDIGQRLLGVDIRFLAFFVLFFAFAIKIPAVPLHTWLPAAHVEAPTAISVILAGVLLKIGGYGIIRIAYGIFPQAAIYFAPLVGGLGLIAILYGAMVTIAQKDFKRMIAYASVSHMGFVLLGLASLNTAGTTGAILQMVNHGLVSAALFILVGVIYDRSGDRRMDNYRGLWEKMPHYAAVAMLLFFAGMGLPGFNTFVSEMMVLGGAVQAGHLSLLLSILAVIGILLAAVYFLRAFRRMFFGEFAYLGKSNADFEDLSGRELLMLVPLLVFIICLGIFPSLMTKWIEPEVINFLMPVQEILGA